MYVCMCCVVTYSRAPNNVRRTICCPLLCPPRTTHSQHRRDQNTRCLGSLRGYLVIERFHLHETRCSWWTELRPVVFLDYRPNVKQNRHPWISRILKQFRGSRWTLNYAFGLFSQSELNLALVQTLPSHVPLFFAFNVRFSQLIDTTALLTASTFHNVGTSFVHFQWWSSSHGISCIVVFIV